MSVEGFQIKVILFIINFRKKTIPIVMYKLRKRASVSEEFAMFNWSSVGSTCVSFVQNKDYPYRVSHLNVWRWSLKLQYYQFDYCLSETPWSFSNKKQNKSATRGAQLVPIWIPTICLYNFEPKLKNIVQKIMESIRHVLTLPQHDHNL